MKDARSNFGSKAAKPRPPVPRVKYSEAISDEHFQLVKDAHKALNSPDAKHGGVNDGAGLFPND